MGTITVLCKDCGGEIDARTEPGPGGGLPRAAEQLLGDFYTTSSGALCLECADRA